MNDEDRVLLQAEVLTKTSAPDFGSPYEKLVEIVDFMVDNDISCGDFASTEMCRSLTDAEAAAFFVYTSLATSGLDEVMPRQVLGQLASAAATILVVHGNFTRKAQA